MGTLTSLVTGLVLVLAAFGLGWLVARMGVAIGLRRLRRATGAPWWERARQIFPARSVILMDLIVLPWIVGMLVLYPIAMKLDLPGRPLGVLSGLACLFGIVVVSRGLERRICQREGAVPRGGPLRALMVIAMMGPLALVVALIPTRWGWPAILVLGLGLGLMLIHLAGGWLPVLRWAGWLRPASPRLASVVARASERVGIRPNRTFEVDSPNANAMAWIWPRYLIFTTPILDVLDDDELGAIAVHELAHLNEPRSVFFLRSFSGLLPILGMASIPLGFTYGPWVALTCPVLMILLLLVMIRVGGKMEERSDRVGRQQEGESSGAYARALESIYRANLLPAVMRGKRQVHPHLYDRMIAAGSPPDYPRPAPPPRNGLAAAPTVLLLVAAFYTWSYSLQTHFRKDPARISPVSAPPPSWRFDNSGRALPRRSSHVPGRRHPDDLDLRPGSQLAPGS
jgi:Zn-dependent protease with chaperone function